MYINKALIFGNLTRDPEARRLPNGTSVTNFSVATNRVWKDKNGAKQEDTQYHNIVCFAKLAELAAQYLHRGGSVYIEGRMQTRSWDAQDGQKKYRTEIIADTMQFGPRREGDMRGGSATAPSGGTEKSAPAPAETEPVEYPSEEVNPDDIPF